MSEFNVVEPAFSYTLRMYYYTSYPDTSGWIASRIYNKLKHEDKDGFMRKYYHKRETAISDFIQADSAGKGDPPPC